MHYAQSWFCRDKMKDRPEEIAPCGSSCARQQIRNDEKLVDCDRITWDFTSKVLTIPPGFSDEQVDVLRRVYQEAETDGREGGKEDMRREFRELLDVSRRDS